MADLPNYLPFEDCNHPPSSVREGPRIQLRWVSGPTDVCGLCIGYRCTLHVPGPWRQWPPKRNREEEDGDDVY